MSNKESVKRFHSYWINGSARSSSGARLKGSGSREHGVLISYLLCGKCARHIFPESEKNPYDGQTALHTEIEKNLKKAFLNYLGH